ncbi:TPA: DegT/DnrJ/EryC1/StrS family aminotransferase [Candidatus Poribacteria bacterium]|nr:DegT/DnrJ/EryC1/StrS family aminotransferase [Candidatus Poribacteria bacterium]
MEKLAIDGGQPVRTKPFPSGKKVGEEELEQLREVIESGNMFQGAKVQEFREGFAKMYGSKYCVSSTSGTASIHVGVAMVNPNPSDEIITSPITDIGTIIPIIYQNCIPIFADIEPYTWNMDAADLERKITEKTKAIIVVHLFGNAADMDAIMAVAKRHNIPVIEDCSQAHRSTYRGKLVGTIGEIGCFSLQQSKHMTTGDGGMTITDDDDYGARGTFFVDKGWQRGLPGARQYIMLGMNYRMTELQAAVGIAQLGKVEQVTTLRNRNGDLLTELISDVNGIATQGVIEGSKHTYWQYGFTVDSDANFTADQFSQALSKEGISCGAHYIGKPIFLCQQALVNKTIFGDSHHPFDLPAARKDVEYTEGLCPVTEAILNRMVTIGISQFLAEEDILDIAKGIRKVAEGLARK